MRFKTSRIKAEWEWETHPLLKQMILWTDDAVQMIRNLAWPTRELMLTSIYRTRAEQIALYPKLPPEKVPSSTHCTKPPRAIDVSVRGFTPQQRLALTAYINEHWRYDPTRPGKQCCLLHKVDASPLHWHLQIHRNTRYIP